MRELRIALVGDCSPAVVAHGLIPTALELAARRLEVTVSPTWIPTPELAHGPTPLLDSLDATWVVPGSPYQSMAGALHAIHHARTTARPFLGTCGGFQHAVIEYARNQLGMDAADHAESNPDAAMAVMSLLSCDLVEQFQEVTFAPGSVLQRAYNANGAEERYQCRFGVNPQYATLFSDTGMRAAALSAQGEIRALEVVGHPFFVGTLYQPSRSASTGKAHPLIAAFVAAAANR